MKILNTKNAFFRFLSYSQKNEIWAAAKSLNAKTNLIMSKSLMAKNENPDRKNEKKTLLRVTIICWTTTLEKLVYPLLELSEFMPLLRNMFESPRFDSSTLFGRAQQHLSVDIYMRKIHQLKQDVWQKWLPALISVSVG